MYDELMNLSFREVKNEFGFESANNMLKIVTLSSSEGITTVSDKSSLMLYYDIRDDKQLLWLIERAHVDDIDVSTLDEIVENLTKQYPEFYSNWEYSKSRSFIDIKMIDIDLYEGLVHEEQRVNGSNESNVTSE